jgi:hypothetical protein
MRSLPGAPWCSLAAVFWLCASCSEPDASGPVAAPGALHSAPRPLEAPASDAPHPTQHTVDARSAATAGSVEFEQLTIRVQLVDPDGLAAKPLRTSQHLVELVGDRVHVSDVGAQLDEHGNATLSCSPRVAGARERMIVIRASAALRRAELRVAPGALLRLPTPANAAILELGTAQLYDPYDDRALRRLSDKDLEREHALLLQLKETDARGLFALSAVQLEMARRGGGRWVKLLRREFEVIRQEESPSTTPAQESEETIEWDGVIRSVDPLGLLARLTLLRRAERRPDPAQLQVHGSSSRDFVVGAPMNLAFGVINVDPTERFFPPAHMYDLVRVRAYDDTGAAITPKERQRTWREGIHQSPRLSPGEASWDRTNGPWQVDVRRDFDLPPGRYTVVLEAPIETLSNEVGSLHGRVTIKSEPFEIVVRARD